MVRRQLDERQWAKIEAVLAAERRAGRPPKDNRNFADGLVREHQEIQRDDINVQTLVIEDHARTSAHRQPSCLAITT